jgi:glycine/D-amino acid oxidase-like deaminating enzyme
MVYLLNAAFPSRWLPQSAERRRAVVIGAGLTGISAALHLGEHCLLLEQREQLEEIDENSTPSVRILAPLLRGELRLRAQVARVTPSRHHLELSDGQGIVYDTLLSTVPLSVLAGMAMHELPGSIRNNDSLRCWLNENDIEVADRGTRASCGDVDGFAAGKRIAEHMNAGLEQRFGSRSSTRERGPRVFEPRLVRASAAPFMR